MHKMRIWFVKIKGAYVSEITLKMPLQKKPQELLLLKINLCNEDLVKWLGGSFIMLIRENIFSKITSVPWLLSSEGDEIMESLHFKKKIIRG